MPRLLAAVNSRLAVVSLTERDHMKLTRRPGQPLGDAVRDAVAAATGWRPSAACRIHMLTMPAILGYNFNPVSFYYVWREDGRAVDTVIAEVTNTPWNEMHYYILREGAPCVTEFSVWESGGGGGGGAVAARAATAPPPPSQQPQQPLAPVCVETPELAAQLAHVGAVAPTDFDALARVFDGGAGVEAGGAAPATADAAADTPASSSRSGRASPSPRRGRRGSIAGGEGAGPGAAAVGPASAPSAGPAPAPVDPPARRRLRFRFDKTFHVSPFMSLGDQDYEWVFSEPDVTLAAPGATLLVQSQNYRRTGGGEGGGEGEGGPAPPPPPRERMLNTQLRLVGQDLTGWRLAYLVFVAFPLLTFRVQWWIHVEAVALWRKGVELYPHPTGASNGFVRAVEALFAPLAWAIAKWGGGGKAPAAAGGGAPAAAAAAPSAGAVTAPSTASSASASSSSVSRRGRGRAASAAAAGAAAPVSA